MNNLFKWIAAFTALTFVLISCAPAPTLFSTPTNTPSKKSLPSATPTLTPAPTATATPTPSPSQIAESLGLPISRSYTIKDSTLIDGPGWVWANWDSAANAWVRNEATVQKKEMWQKALAEQVGSDWNHGFFKYSNVKEFAWMGFFYAMSDGKLVTEPKLVYDKDGGLLFTVTAGSWVYYLDIKGDMQSVYRPLVIKFNDEKMIWTGNMYEYYSNEMPIFINNCDQSSKDDPGEVVLTTVVVDIDQYFKNNSKYISNKKLPQGMFFDVLQKYNQENNVKFKNFVDTGDPTIRIILTSGLSCGADAQIQLP